MKLKNLFFSFFAITPIFCEGLTLKGSPAVAAVMRKALLGYPNYKNVNIEVSSSEDGLKCVRKNKCDIGLVAHNLEEKELKDLDRTIYGYDSLVFIVNSENSLSTITKDQANQIFCQGLKNWSSISGKEAPILTYNRDNDTGPAEEFTKNVCKVKKIKSVKRGAYVYLVSQEPNAIAFVGLSSAKKNEKRVKTLQFEGVLPTKENIISGAYPFKREISLVYKKDSANKEIAEFIKFAFDNRENVMSVENMVPAN